MPISTTSQINQLLQHHAAIGIGVSGGKDSSAAAWATNLYLDEIGHQGARLLIHSDLGRIEWQDSLPACQRLADRLQMELIVVRREAGDLLDRWQVRWENNVERYRQLECVKLILPWSTPSMRFCTSELKTALIARKLVALLPGQTILSVSGIRRQESTQRAKAPVMAPQANRAVLPIVRPALTGILSWTGPWSRFGSAITRTSCRCTKPTRHTVLPASPAVTASCQVCLIY